MKNKIKTGWNIFELLIVCAIIALMAAFAPPARAQDQQGQPVLTGDCLSNAVAILTTSTNLAAGNVAIIKLRQGKGISFAPRWNCLGTTNTGAFAMCYAVANDPLGVNFSTTTPIIVRSLATGTTAGRDWIFVSPTTLSGATAMKLLTVTNDVLNTAGLTITNIPWAIPQNP